MRTIKEVKMLQDGDKKEWIAIVCNPNKHGYKKCSECLGFGNDNRKIDSTVEICDICGGDGVLPMTDAEKSELFKKESGIKADEATVIIYHHGI
jgi:hypothetical protein